MTKKRDFSTTGRWLLAGLMLIIFADLAVGTFVRADVTQYCKRHAIHNTPGRGPGTSSWSTDEYAAIVHSCSVEGTEAQLNMTQLPFNKALVTHQLASAMAQCDELPNTQRHWGCRER